MGGASPPLETFFTINKHSGFCVSFQSHGNACAFRLPPWCTTQQEAQQQYTHVSMCCALSYLLNLGQCARLELTT